MLNTNKIIQEIKKLPLEEKVKAINHIKQELHKISPFYKHPTDCVVWVKTDYVEKNGYNPNFVAQPEFDLLKTSILEDGYTQPIVVFKRGYVYEIVDGFHRSKLAKECSEIRDKVSGYIPVAIINQESEDKDHRISATIRHNRARCVDQVDAMSKIVVGLRKNGWTNKKISKKLGMDQDEVLRLSQISGLMEIFKDQEFSEAWEVEEFDVQ